RLAAEGKKLQMLGLGQGRNPVARYTGSFQVQVIEFLDRQMGEPAVAEFVRSFERHPFQLFQPFELFHAGRRDATADYAEGVQVLTRIQVLTASVIDARSD